MCVNVFQGTPPTKVDLIGDTSWIYPKLKSLIGWSSHVCIHVQLMFTCCTIILRCSNEFCYILRVGYKRRSVQCLQNTMHRESEEDWSSQKSKIYSESAEESWAVAYKELSYSQHSTSSSVMSSFFQDGMQEPFQELVSLSLTSLSLYFIALTTSEFIFNKRNWLKVCQMVGFLLFIDN